MRIFRKALSILFALGCFMLLMSLSAHADEGWKITHFNSALAIQPDGRVAVTEIIDVDFGVLAKHGIYRDLPYVYNAAATGNKTYTDVSVSAVQLDGLAVPYKEQKDDSNLRIQIGDAHKTITGKHTYQLHYFVSGVLQHYKGYDELYWNVTGSDWPVLIGKVTAQVILPKPKVMQASCYEGTYGSTKACQFSIENDTTAGFAAQGPLVTGQDMTIAVGYTPGIVPLVSVPAPTPTWQGIQWPIAALSGALVFVLGVAWTVRQWLRFGRDEGGKKGTIVPEFAVPGKLRPAEMGVLVDERADTLDVSSTIVDLAVRGYLTITEEDKKGLFGMKDYQLKKIKMASSALLEYENLLLAALFKYGDEVRLSALKEVFYTDLARVKSALYAEVVKKGLFTQNPEQVRQKYGGLSIVLVILSALAGWVIFKLLPPDTLVFSVLLGVMAGLIGAGVVLGIFSGSMPARTAHGFTLYRQALGYKLFISKAEKYRAQFMEKENMYEQVLPYAIVFGVTKELAQAMKALEVKPPQPGWYYGSHVFNPIFFATNMNTFSQSLATAMAYTPQGSGSGGGGFSGGGFGGGGGGSW